MTDPFDLLSETQRKSWNAARNKKSSSFSCLFAVKVFVLSGLDVWNMGDSVCSQFTALGCFHAQTLMWPQIQSLQFKVMCRTTSVKPGHQHESLVIIRKHDKQCFWPKLTSNSMFWWRHHYGNPSLYSMLASLLAATIVVLNKKYNSGGVLQVNWA